MTRSVSHAIVSVKQIPRQSVEQFWYKYARQNCNTIHALSSFTRIQHWLNNKQAMPYNNNRHEYISPLQELCQYERERESEKWHNNHAGVITESSVMPWTWNKVMLKYVIYRYHAGQRWEEAFPLMGPISKLMRWERLKLRYVFSPLLEASVRCWFNARHSIPMQVFADNDSSLNPIDIPRALLWNLPRRTVYFGTSIPTIFRGDYSNWYYLETCSKRENNWH